MYKTAPIEKLDKNQGCVVVAHIKGSLDSYKGFFKGVGVCLHLDLI